MSQVSRMSRNLHLLKVSDLAQITANLIFSEVNLWLKRNKVENNNKKHFKLWQSMATDKVWPQCSTDCLSFHTQWEVFKLKGMHSWCVMFIFIHSLFLSFSGWVEGGGYRCHTGGESTAGPLAHCIHHPSPSLSPLPTSFTFSLYIPLCLCLPVSLFISLF